MPSCITSPGGGRTFRPPVMSIPRLATEVSLLEYLDRNRSLLRVWDVVSVAAVLSALLPACLAAQSGSKVLTPPKPADTARGAATRPTSAASATPQPGTGMPVPQSPVLDSIRQAVFRNLLERDRAGFATLASAFCLAVSNETFKSASGSTERVDAPEPIVRRVQTSRAPARRASGCTFSGNAPARGVPGRALLYTVGAIAVDESRAEAAAGYNYDGYSAGGYTFTLERSDSGWVVKQWRMEWTGKP